MITAKFLTVVVSAGIFFLVLELIRQEKLTFKYALGWIVVAILGTGMALFDRLLGTLAHAMGFSLPSNFIFFVLICVLMFLSLLMTIFLCQQDSRNQIVAQKIGILETQIRELREGQGPADDKDAAS